MIFKRGRLFQSGDDKDNDNVDDNYPDKDCDYDNRRIFQRNKCETVKLHPQWTTRASS